MNLIDCKNLIILYLPGLGGNHLANLLSTCTDHFEPRFESADYANELANRYDNETARAHHSDIPNLNLNSLESNFEKLINSKKTNILCGHYGEVNHVRHILDKLPNKNFIAIGLPEMWSKEIATLRILHHNNASAQSYIWNEIASIYTRTTMSKLTDTDVHKTMVIRSSDLFSPDLGNVSSQLKDSGIELPNIAHKIHQLWFDKLYKFYGTQ